MSSYAAAERDLALAKQNASLKDLRLMKNDMKLAKSLGRMVLSGPSSRRVYKSQFRSTPNIAKREREAKRVACASEPNKKQEEAKISSILHLLTRKKLPIRAKNVIGQLLKDNKSCCKGYCAGKKRKTYKRKKGKKSKKN